MPLPGEIGKAYAHYYTHTTENPDKPARILARIYYRMKRGYLANRYHYETVSGNPSVAGGANTLKRELQRECLSSRFSVSSLDRLLGKLLYLFPLRRATQDDEIRSLPALPRGRLLDVGCGSGKWLLKMRDLDWQVEGLDFDESAVRVANQHGLAVRLGTVEQQRYPESSFDAVSLNHVIEHVPDPIGTLAECHRILKKGGKLVLATPNISSLGHCFFKQDWRGLEPPRHLHVFGPGSMAAALSEAGFRWFVVRTVNSDYVWRQSFQLWIGQTLSNSRNPFYVRLAARFVPQLLTLVEQALLFIKPKAGEYLSVAAIKS
jgi:2-polyprenyl-3-methyl-5-hydroxy-6-metoxy-1,4-benzoquinol methylase